MAKIAKMQNLTKAKEYYYEKDPIMNPDGNNEHLTIQGNIAEGLGLTQGDTLTEEEFGNLLKGYTADGETQLVDRMKFSNSGKENFAYDYVNSAPKSVSVLGLTVDPRLVEAHEEANQEVMNYIHENYGHVNNKVDGKNEAKMGGGMLSASAQHSIARDVYKGVEDPHLHTHNIIFNIGFDKEKNEFKALHSMALLKDTNMLNDMYRSVLAKKVEALGYTIEMHNEKGNSTAWDIAGFDREEINHFSQRHNSIEGDNLLDREASQHMGKNEKNEHTGDELIEDWHSQQQETFGRSFEEIKDHALSLKESLQETPKFENAMSVLEHAMKGLTDNEVLIDEKQILKVATAASMGEFDQKELRDALHSVKKIGQTEPDNLKAVDTEEGRVYTTKRLWDMERENVYIVKNQANSAPLMSRVDALDQIQKFNDKQVDWNLSSGQEAAVEAMLTNSKENLVLNGNAGTGKTTLMENFHDAIKDIHGDKVNIIALAPTGAAAKEIEDASGIQSMTIDKFLLKTQDERFMEELNSKPLEIIVDEAGMVSGEKANELLHFAKDLDQDVHTTWVGDVKQFKSVQAMDFFGDIQKYVESVDLTEANRFKTELTRTTSDLVNAGEVDKALEWLDKNKMIVKLDLEGDNRIAEETKLALGSVDKPHRESDTVFDEKVMKEDWLNVAAERNQLNESVSKAKGSELASLEEKLRDKQQEFFNKQVVFRDGFSLNDVQAYAAGNMSEENGQRFVSNSLKNAEKLVDAGILKESETKGEFIFVDPKAKEILSTMADKPMQEIAQGNLKEYEVANGTHKEVVDPVESKAQEAKEEPKLTRAEVFAKAALKETGGDPTMPIIASKNKTIDAVNREARSAYGLDKKEQVSTEVFRTKQGFNDPAKRVVAANYSEGDIVQTSQNVKGMKAMSSYTVESVDTTKNELTMSTQFINKEGDMETHTTTVNAKDLIKATVSEKEQKDFAEGDKIVFLRNTNSIADKDGNQVPIKNGNVGFVKEIDQDRNKLTVDIGKDGKVQEVEVYLNEYKNINHGFGITANKSQGGTYKEGVVILDSQDSTMNNKNSVLVEFTRFKNQFKVVTDDLEAVKEQVQSMQFKTTTLDKDEHAPDVVKETVNKEEAVSKISDTVESMKKGEEVQTTDSPKGEENVASNNTMSLDEKMNNSESFENSKLAQLEISEDNAQKGITAVEHTEQLNEAAKQSQESVHTL